MLFNLSKLRLPGVKSNIQSRSVKHYLNEFKTNPDLVEPSFRKKNSEKFLQNFSLFFNFYRSS